MASLTASPRLPQLEAMGAAGQHYKNQFDEQGCLHGGQPRLFKGDWVRVVREDGEPLLAQVVAYNNDGEVEDGSPDRLLDLGGLYTRFLTAADGAASPRRADRVDTSPTEPDSEELEEQPSPTPNYTPEAIDTMRKHLVQLQAIQEQCNRGDGDFSSRERVQRELLRQMEEFVHNIDPQFLPTSARSPDSFLEFSRIQARRKFFSALDKLRSEKRPKLLSIVEMVQKNKKGKKGSRFRMLAKNVIKGMKGPPGKPNDNLMRAATTPLS